MMQFKINIDQHDFVATRPTDETVVPVTSEASEIRRRMYERIAQGNALAHVEEDARRAWQK